VSQQSSGPSERPWSRPPLSIHPPSKAEESTVDMTRLLQREEVTRSRVFFRVVILLALLTAGFTPFLQGESWMRATTAGLCVFVAFVSLAVLLHIRKPDNYTPVVATTAGVVLGIVGVGVIYYVGVFSAAAMVLSLGVYFMGMSHSRVAARTTYVVIAGLYLIVSCAVAADVLPDKGLFSSHVAHEFSRWFQVVMSQVIFALTLFLARSSRRATEGAVDRANKAALQIKMRDALLDEARGELARALGPGEGRFTGRRIAELEVGPVLGRGAMGEVYRATNDAGNDVAIKTLHTNLVDNPDQVKRFMREAETASAVDSPHVPQIYQSGFTEDGTPYLVMELLEGHDLGWHLRRKGRLERDQVVELCEQVAEALAHVRRAQIVHRDLKPANLFLTDSLPRTWKVLDFGLSKMIYAGGSLTRDMAVGTPSYMAPEQIKGPKVDHLSDLYALAAIAYRAITGSPPFSGNEIAHVLYSVVYQQPSSPAELASIPVDVELVLALGMAKDRDQRFSQVEEFAAAMRAAWHGQLADDYRARAWALLKAAPWGSSRTPTRKKKSA
jgi:serine/threonine-protein kinase